MRRIFPALTLALATAPVIALALGLLGIGSAAFEIAAARLLAGGWFAAAVLFASVGPLIALVLYRHRSTQTEMAHQRAPSMNRHTPDVVRSISDVPAVLFVTFRRWQDIRPWQSLSATSKEMPRHGGRS